MNKSINIKRRRAPKPSASAAALLRRLGIDKTSAEQMAWRAFDHARAQIPGGRARRLTRIGAMQHRMTVVAPPIRGSLSNGEKNPRHLAGLRSPDGKRVKPMGMQAVVYQDDDGAYVVGIHCTPLVQRTLDVEHFRKLPHEACSPVFAGRSFATTDLPGVRCALLLHPGIGDLHDTARQALDAVAAAAASPPPAHAGNEGAACPA